jgi:hypothetical protein
MAPPRQPALVAKPSALRADNDTFHSSGRGISLPEAPHPRTGPTGVPLRRPKGFLDMEWPRG